MILLSACQAQPSSTSASNDYAAYGKSHLSSHFPKRFTPYSPVAENTKPSIKAAKSQPAIAHILAYQAAKQTSEFTDTAALDSQELGAIRGAFAPSDSGILGLLDAINAHNNSSNSVTGSNIVNSSAFTNNSGLVSIVQNSGNNVIIQNATLVNLQLQ